MPIITNHSNFEHKELDKISSSIPTDKWIGVLKDSNCGYNYKIRRYEPSHQNGGREFGLRDIVEISKRKLEDLKVKVTHSVNKHKIKYYKKQAGDILKYTKTTQQSSYLDQLLFRLARILHAHFPYFFKAPQQTIALSTDEQKKMEALRDDVVKADLQPQASVSSSKVDEMTSLITDYYKVKMDLKEPRKQDEGFIKDFVEKAVEKIRINSTEPVKVIGNFYLSIVTVNGKEEISLMKRDMDFRDDIVLDRYFS